MITINDLKEHCKRQLERLPKGSKMYEEHLLTLGIIEALKERNIQIDLMAEVIFQKFKAPLIIEYGIENKEQFIKIFEQKAKEKRKEYEKNNPDNKVKKI